MNFKTSKLSSDSNLTRLNSIRHARGGHTGSAIEALSLQRGQSKRDLDDPSSQRLLQAAKSKADTLSHRPAKSMVIGDLDHLAHVGNHSRTVRSMDVAASTATTRMIAKALEEPDGDAESEDEDPDASSEDEEYESDKDYEGTSENNQLRRILNREPSMRTEEEKMRLRALVDEKMAFLPLPEEKKARLCDVMRYRLVAKPAVLFRQGDRADKFYTILAGEVVGEKWTDGEKITFRLEAGQSFGEMGLLNNAPRNATVSVPKGAELITVTKRHYEKLLRPADATEMKARNTFVAQLPLMKNMNQETISNVSAFFFPARYAPGQVVVAQGSKPDFVFFIKSGSALVSLPASDEADGFKAKYAGASMGFGSKTVAMKELATLGDREAFGLVALVPDSTTKMPVRVSAGRSPLDVFMIPAPELIKYIARGTIREWVDMEKNRFEWWATRAEESSHVSAVVAGMHSSLAAGAQAGIGARGRRAKKLRAGHKDEGGVLGVAHAHAPAPVPVLTDRFALPVPSLPPSMSPDATMPIHAPAAAFKLNKSSRDDELEARRRRARIRKERQERHDQRHASKIQKTDKKFKQRRLSKGIWPQFLLDGAMEVPESPKRGADNTAKKVGFFGRRDSDDSDATGYAAENEGYGSFHHGNRRGRKGKTAQDEEWSRETRRKRLHESRRDQEARNQEVRAQARVRSFPIRSTETRAGDGNKGLDPDEVLGTMDLAYRDIKAVVALPATPTQANARSPATDAKSPEDAARATGATPAAAGGRTGLAETSYGSFGFGAGPAVHAYKSHSYANLHAAALAHGKSMHGKSMHGGTGAAARAAAKAQLSQSHSVLVRGGIRTKKAVGAGARGLGRPVTTTRLTYSRLQQRLISEAEGDSNSSPVLAQAGIDGYDGDDDLHDVAVDDDIESTYGASAAGKMTPASGPDDVSTRDEGGEKRGHHPNRRGDSAVPPLPSQTMLLQRGGPMAGTLPPGSSLGTPGPVLGGVPSPQSRGFGGFTSSRGNTDAAGTPKSSRLGTGTGTAAGQKVPITLGELPEVSEADQHAASKELQESVGNMFSTHAKLRRAVAKAAMLKSVAGAFLGSGGALGGAAPSGAPTAMAPLSKAGRLLAKADSRRASKIRNEVAKHHAKAAAQEARRVSQLR